MPRRQDAIDFFEKINLAQKISARDPRVKEYVGSDVETARTIATINILEEFKMISPKIADFIKKMLIEQNKAVFWSSEKTDIFTKLGGFKPQHERIFGLGVKGSDKDDDSIIIQKHDKDPSK